MKIPLKEQDGNIRDSYYGTTQNLHGNPSLLKGEERRGCIPPSNSLPLGERGLRQFMRLATNASAPSSNMIESLTT